MVICSTQPYNPYAHTSPKAVFPYMAKLLWFQLIGLSIKQTTVCAEMVFIYTVITN